MAGTITMVSMGKMTLDKLAGIITKEFNALRQEMNDGLNEANHRIDVLQRYTKEGFADLHTDIENWRLVAIDERDRLERLEKRFGN